MVQKKKTILVDPELRDNLNRLRKYWDSFNRDRVTWDYLFTKCFPAMCDFIGQNIFGEKLWKEMKSNPNHPMRPSQSEYELKLRELQQLNEYY